jgi:hypothetical protein
MKRETGKAYSSQTRRAREMSPTRHRGFRLRRCCRSGVRHPGDVYARRAVLGPIPAVPLDTALAATALVPPRRLSGLSTKRARRIAKHVLHGQRLRDASAGDPAGNRRGVVCAPEVVRPWSGRAEVRIAEALAVRRISSLLPGGSRHPRPCSTAEEHICGLAWRAPCRRGRPSSEPGATPRRASRRRAAAAGTCGSTGFRQIEGRADHEISASLRRVSCRPRSPSGTCRRPLPAS